jgi:hypothetical protein
MFDPACTSVSLHRMARVTALGYTYRSMFPARHLFHNKTGRVRTALAQALILFVGIYGPGNTLQFKLLFLFGQGYTRMLVLDMLIQERRCCVAGIHLPMSPSRFEFRLRLGVTPSTVHLVANCTIFRPFDGRMTWL